ncbi:trifunctional purine biosynthetic protein adenosine-3-like isoform X2 [Amphibalanus amphitrite]|nr:trifunctional purine biosynthetic protein adenosine-3-like isoform X2 [Amphibalanus amphitrite]
MECVAVNVKEHEAVVSLCRDRVRSVDLVIVGPEDPLADGLADSLRRAGVPCFGPSAAGARIEADKAYAKRLMEELRIPTAPFSVFTDADSAKEYIRSGPNRLVVKASGLAAGKGVVVAADAEEACQAVEDALLGGRFGEAGAKVVVEEKLQGEEVSVMAFTDGRHVAVMPPAQDHKRLLSGDRGPNTGGMGAVAPAPGPLTTQQLSELEQLVFQRLVDHWVTEGISYCGVLYAGLMVTATGPYVLEYNCRFGDPETEVLLPLLQSDLFDIVTACVEDRLCPTNVSWRTDAAAVDVVLVSAGYPGSYPKNLEITGLDAAAAAGCQLFHAGTRRSEPAGSLLTSGGRVLNLVAVADSVAAARQMALQAAQLVQFDGKQYREDIAARALAREILSGGSLTYKSAGVDIGAGDAFVGRIAALLRQRPVSSAVLGGLGGFGGLFDLSAVTPPLTDPLLVVGTDGVGTKLKVAQACGRPEGLGVDLVAMCVNDVLCQGARPLLFLDYLAAGRLSAAPIDRLVAGVVEGCQQAGCDLLGGETAEMPGVYSDSGYDLAGFAVGAVERTALLPRTDLMAPGDALLALPAAGLHSNGFSLVRRAVEAAGLDYLKDKAPFQPEAESLGAALLTPTRIYAAPMRVLLSAPGLITGAAHITGGGLPGNIPRCLPDGLVARLDMRSWLNITQPAAAAAAWVALVGGVSAEELARTFNLGLGMVVVVPAGRRQEALELAAAHGHQLLEVGKLEARGGVDGEGYDVRGSQVVLDGLESQLSAVMAQLTAAGARPVPPPPSARPLMPVGVLISGSGTNLQALLDYCSKPGAAAKVVLVISNKPGVGGLTRAEAAGVPTRVIRHTEYGSREEFDLAMHSALESAGVQLVCCAGFMRILSPRFVQLWRGRLLNIHPSLLPLFPGLHVHRQALQAGVRVSGCSVHFIEEEVDAGAILVQRTVPVLAGDTEQQLEERIKTAEHVAYPEALHLVATGAVTRGQDGRLLWRESHSAGK